MGWWWKSCQHLLLFIGLDKSPLCNLIQFSPQLSVGQSSNHRVTDASIEPESILAVRVGHHSYGQCKAVPLLPAGLCRLLAQLCRRAAPPADVCSVLGSSHPIKSRGWGKGVVHWMTLAGLLSSHQPCLCPSPPSKLFEIIISVILGNTPWSMHYLSADPVGCGRWLAGSAAGWDSSLCLCPGSAPLLTIQKPLQTSSIFALQ